MNEFKGLLLWNINTWLIKPKKFISKMLPRTVNTVINWLSNWILLITISSLASRLNLTSAPKERKKTEWGIKKEEEENKNLIVLSQNLQHQLFHYDLEENEKVMKKRLTIYYCLFSLFGNLSFSFPWFVGVGLITHFQLNSSEKLQFFEEEEDYASSGI